MAERWEVIAPGAEVTIGGGIVGTVLAVCLRDGSVTYEVSWWDGNTYHNKWLADFEVAPRRDDARTLQIGFLPCT